MRAFLLAALVGASVGVAATPTLAHAGNGKGLLPLVADDAQFVLVVDLKDLRDAPSLGTLASDTDALPGMADVGGVLSQSGIDPKKDLDTLLVSGKEGELVMVAEGKLSSAQKKALTQGSTSKTYRGVTYWTDTRGEGAFLGKRTIVVTQPGGMRVVIDRYKKKTGSLTKSPKAAELRDAIGLTDLRNDVWLAFTGELLAARGAPALGFDAMSVAASLETDLAVVIRGRATDADAASSFVTMAGQFLPQVRDSMKQQGLAATAGSLGVDQDDRVVDAHATVPAKELGKLVSLVKSM